MLRARRRGLSAEAQQRAAIDLMHRLCDLEVVQKSKRIAMYLTNDGEIDPVEFMNWAWENDKLCYLPVVIQTNLNSLLFAPVTRETRFVDNCFQIPEPVVDEDELIQARELDLVLLPLVGFDSAGNRIGMGGGFYDTTFEFIREGQSRIEMIGLAHELQKVDVIEAESWDIPLATIVTDQSVHIVEDMKR